MLSNEYYTNKNITIEPADARTTHAPEITEDKGIIYNYLDKTDNFNVILLYDFLYLLMYTNIIIDPSD